MSLYTNFFGKKNVYNDNGVNIIYEDIHIIHEGHSSFFKAIVRLFKTILSQKILNRNQFVAREFYKKDGKAHGIGRQWGEYLGGGDLNKRSTYLKLESLHNNGFPVSKKHYTRLGAVAQEVTYDSSSNNINNIKAFYQNGQLKEEMTYDSSSVNIKTFYENGQLNMDYNNISRVHLGEILDDVFFRYNQSGTLLEENRYSAGRPVGVQKGYYENGNIKSEVIWKTVEFTLPVPSHMDNVLDGISKYYYDKGGMQKEIHYKNGVEIESKCFDEYGNEIACD